MNCPCAAVGWSRPEQEAFIREIYTGSAPPIPALQRTTRTDLAPCGVWLERLPGTFCSLCFDAVESGVRLSDNEILCTVCTSHTFDSAEQYDAASPQPPRVALLASTETDGRVAREDLTGLRGRALTLMLDVRVGDELRFCSCLPSTHVRGKLGVFVGYCTRRQLAILRIGDALACMSMADSSADALMLRRPHDESVALHEAMLSHLTPVASKPTLQAALSTVRAAHTLCGTSTLTAAEALLARLTAHQEHDDALLQTPKYFETLRAAPSRRASPAGLPGGHGLPRVMPRVEEEPRALSPAHTPEDGAEDGGQQGLAAQLSRANTCPLELSSKPHSGGESAVARVEGARVEGASQQAARPQAPLTPPPAPQLAPQQQQRARCGPMCGWIACGCAK